MADENDTDLPLPRLEEGEVSSDPATLTRGAPVPKAPSDLEQLFDVPVTVSAVLGHATAASARRSTSSSTIASWRAAKSSSSTSASASP
jgi:hypothetical protein